MLAVCLVALFASGAANLPGKYTDAENNESTSFLPSDAESTEVLRITEELQGGEQAPVVIVYRREGGLTEEDQARIAADREELNTAIEENRDDIYRAVSPFAEPRPSESGDAALLIGNITGDGDGDTILDPVDDIRERVSDPGGGLEVKVTGPAGFAADAIKVFENINGTLLGSALLLVVVLLILIYRSPIFLWIPLFAVVFAEVATRSIGYGLTEIGVTVNGQSSAILSILVLGAGTDYALLLVSRYREELRKHEDKHEAMALALRTAGPAIVASGATVICALLCLTIAEVEGTAGLGPIGALGIAVAMVTMLTLLPALLVICGRRAFWHPPMGRWGNGIPHFGDEGADETHGPWRRVGERVARSPRRIWVGTVALLAVCALGVLTIDTGLTEADAYRDEVESIEGQELLALSFPAGASAATEVIVPPGGDVQAVTGALEGADGVAQVLPTDVSGPPGTLVNAVLEPEPYSTAAFDLIPGIRAAVKEAGGPERAGRRAVGDPVRRAPGGRARHARDHPDRARRRAADPDPAAALAAGAAAADRDRDPLVRGGARDQHRDLRRHLRLRRRRPVVPAVRLHLPGGAGDRLQHLPDGARPRGDDAPRDPPGHDPRPRRDRRRDHLRGHRARGHVLDPRAAAARVPDRDRVRDRVRRAAGHVHSPLGARAGAGARHRAEDLVAIAAGADRRRRRRHGRPRRREPASRAWACATAAPPAAEPIRES